MKKIGILTSGGDAPGMNACIRAVVRSAIYHNLEPVGIMRGYCGLIDADFVELTRRSVANIIQRGGTILETSRCPDMMTVEGRAHAIEILKTNDIDALILIGGDGTFRGASALEKEGQVKVIGIPGTIDNDVYGSDFTIGFDTAINTALDAIDRIRDTADAFQRVFFVEVMGHSSGFIALEVGIAGGGEEIIVPEREIEMDELCDTLVESFKKGKRSSLIVVAEGDNVGQSMKMAAYVEEKLKISARACVLGHIQRGGKPTARDRVLASKLGMAAIDGLMLGKTAHAVGEKQGKVVYIPIEDTWNKKKLLDLHLLGEARILAQ